MPANKKPAVDWPRIHARYVGEYLTKRTPLRVIAREEGVAHPSIIEKAKKEGWNDPDGGSALPPAPTTPDQMPTVPTEDRYVAINGGKMTPAVMDQILADYSLGLGHSLVAAKNGISEKTLLNWRTENPDFALQILRAQANRPARAVKAVNDDIDRGNGALAMKYLERHAMTKEDWADATKNPGGVNITLNIPLPGTVSTIEPVTIDQPKDEAA